MSVVPCRRTSSHDYLYIPQRLLYLIYIGSKRGVVLHRFIPCFLKVFRADMVHELEHQLSHVRVDTPVDLHQQRCLHWTARVYRFNFIGLETVMSEECEQRL